MYPLDLDTFFHIIFKNFCSFVWNFPLNVSMLHVLKFSGERTFLKNLMSNFITYGQRALLYLYSLDFMNLRYSQFCECFVCTWKGMFSVSVFRVQHVSLWATLLRMLLRSSLLLFCLLTLLLAGEECKSPIISVFLVYLSLLYEGYCCLVESAY